MLILLIYYIYLYIKFYYIINLVIIIIVVFLNRFINFITKWGLGIGDWAQSPIPNPQYNELVS